MCDSRDVSVGLCKVLSSITIVVFCEYLAKSVSMWNSIQTHAPRINSLIPVMVCGWNGWIIRLSKRQNVTADYDKDGDNMTHKRSRYPAHLHSVRILHELSTSRICKQIDWNIRTAPTHANLPNCHRKQCARGGENNEAVTHRWTPTRTQLHTRSVAQQPAGHWGEIVIQKARETGSIAQL